MTEVRGYTPLVSVIMSTHNGTKFLSEAVESILEQTLTNFEFIIVNDGAGSETAEILGRYKDSRIRVIEQEQKGLTKALNIAINECRGRYIARIDDDDVAYPDRLKEQLEYHSQHPQCVCSGTWADVIDEQSRVIEHIEPRFNSSKPIEELFWSNPFIHSSLFFDGNILRKFMYDERFIYSQDRDLLLRLSDQHQIGIFPKILIKYRRRSGSITYVKEQEQKKYALLAVKESLGRREVPFRYKTYFFIKQVLANLPLPLELLKRFIFEIIGLRKSPIFERIDVIHVIPGKREDILSMVFAREQVQDLITDGYKAEIFFLESRTNPYSLLVAGLKFRKLLKKKSPRVVHAQFGTMTAFFCAIFSRKIPFVITFRGSDLNPVGSKRSFRVSISHALSHVASVYAQKLICVSDELKGRLSQESQKKVIVLTDNVNLDLFKPLDRNACRERLGLESDEKIIIFNGGREPEIKRVDIAREVVHAVKTSFNSVRFITLDGSICRDDVALYLNAADCLLVTSDYEGSPTIVREALACNLPIVSVDVGDVILQLENVFPSYVSDRNVQQLAQKVMAIFTNSQRSNGFSVISERQRSRNSTRVLKQIYDQINLI